MKYFSLKGEPEFLEIWEGDTVYYGADQKWLMHRTGQLGGCGVVAAAELLSYLAMQCPQYRALYDYGTLSKEAFVLYMQEVYNCVKPLAPGLGRMKMVLGVWPAYRFVRGIRRFAAQRGIRLDLSVIHSFRGEQAIAEYLKQALSADCPVAMLIGFNRRFDGSQVERPDKSTWRQDDFGRHWVVITAMNVDGDGQIFLKVSTWGGYTVLNLADWVQGGFWPQALVRIVP